MDRTPRRKAEAATHLKMTDKHRTAGTTSRVILPVLDNAK